MTDTPATGHNHLRSMLDRIVRLESEKRELSESIKEIYTEAKSGGYDKKALRVLVKREMETNEQREKRETTENAVEMMEAALGSFVQTPLGESAVERVRALTPKVSRELVVERV